MYIYVRSIYIKTMIQVFRYSTLIFLFVLLLLLCTTTNTCTDAAASSSSTDRNRLLSPIPNFGPSLTASSVGSTTIAIPFHLRDIVIDSNVNSNNNNDINRNVVENNDDAGTTIIDDIQPHINAVVMIFRTTKVSSSLQQDEKNESSDVNKAESTNSIGNSGLRIIGPIYTSISSELNFQYSDIQQQQQQQRWYMFGPTTLCTMTGFIPDMDYIVRYIQNYIYNEYNIIYDSSSIETTQHISVQQIMDVLSTELQSSCESNSGRPYGIQTILVGSIKSNIDSSSSSSTQQLCIYTLDINGNINHWRGGTAIGYNAHNVRQQVYDLYTRRHDNTQNRYCSTNNNEDGYTLLQIGLQASIIAQQQQQQQQNEVDKSNNPSSSSDTDDYYEAILIWQQQDQQQQQHILNVAQIDPKQIRDIQHSIITMNQTYNK